MPVDTLYRTSIISSSTVLRLNPFVNPSLAPLSLFLTYGSDLGVWPDCWVSAEFLRTPIPRKGLGSTTTTTTTTLSRPKTGMLKAKVKDQGHNAQVFSKKKKKKKSSQIFRVVSGVLQIKVRKRS